MQQAFKKYLLVVTILLGGVSQIFAHTSLETTEASEQILDHLYHKTEEVNRTQIISESHKGEIDLEKFFTEITESEEVESNQKNKNNPFNTQDNIAIVFFYAFYGSGNLGQSGAIFYQNRILTSVSSRKKYIQFQVFRI